MIKASLVTGNANKLREWQRLTADSLDLVSQAIDLLEIQSLDSAEIIGHKARQAYELVGTPVIVEDVSAGLTALHGLPGPFIKFFEERLGEDALYKLVNTSDASAIITCTVGYYDGQRLVIATGAVHGSVVPPRGENGFGFDKVFMPDGGAKTFAQMSPGEKDAISHRHLAIDDLLRQL